jgi:hypothetical protein
MMAKRGILLSTVLAAALVLAAAPASPAPGPGGAMRPTVEPTLALTIDLAFDGVDRGRAGSSGVLRIDLSAVDDVAEVALALRTPYGLTLDAAPPRFAALHRGEARTVAVPFRAAAGRDLPLRIEATFRTSDGAVRTLGQGITFTATEPPPPGRRTLGAYECRAVPLQELHR